VTPGVTRVGLQEACLRAELCQDRADFMNEGKGCSRRAGCDRVAEGMVEGWGMTGT
jgi:hypothetical protein